MVFGSSPSKEQLGGIRDPLLLETTVFFALLLLHKNRTIVKSKRRFRWCRFDAADAVSLSLMLFRCCRFAVAVAVAVRCRCCCRFAGAAAVAVSLALLLMLLIDPLLLLLLSIRNCCLWDRSIVVCCCYLFVFFFLGLRRCVFSVLGLSPYKSGRKSTGKKNPCCCNCKTKTDPGMCKPRVILLCLLVGLSLYKPCRKSTGKKNLAIISQNISARVERERNAWVSKLPCTGTQVQYIVK